MTPNLVVLLACAEAVLFDFDGPLCDVFAGLPAERVARSLEALLGDAVQSDDPLEVLQIAGRTRVDLVRTIEDALISSELDALTTSVANDNGVASLRALLRTGRKVGVLSNNSREVVSAFLQGEGLADSVSPIIGREYARPDLMKPDSWPLGRLLDEIGSNPRRTVLIGDSLTDIEVAAKLNIACIALANQSGKRERFEAAGAAAVVESMAEVVEAIERGGGAHTA